MDKISSAIQRYVGQSSQESFWVIQNHFGPGDDVAIVISTELPKEEADQIYIPGMFQEVPRLSHGETPKNEALSRLGHLYERATLIDRIEVGHGFLGQIKGCNSTPHAPSQVFFYPAELDNSPHLVLAVQYKLYTGNQENENSKLRKMVLGCFMEDRVVSTMFGDDCLTRHTLHPSTDQAYVDFFIIRNNDDTAWLGDAARPEFGSN